MEQVKLLFSNLEEMIEIHTTFNAAMKQQRKESVIVGDVGNLLLEMVSTFFTREPLTLEG